MSSSLPQTTIDELVIRYRTFRKKLWSVVHDHRERITAIVEHADQTRVQSLQREINSDEN